MILLECATVSLYFINLKFQNIMKVYGYSQVNKNFQKFASRPCDITLSCVLYFMKNRYDHLTYVQLITF